MNTDKLEDALTTKVLEEKGVKGNINGVLDPGGGTKAKERINCKYPDGKEKQPGTENDDPGDAKEDRYLSGIDPTAVYMKKCMQRYSNPRNRYIAALKRF